MMCFRDFHNAMKRGHACFACRHHIQIDNSVTQLTDIAVTQFIDKECSNCI